MEENKDIQQKVSQVVNVGIPSLYFNGFGVSINASDLAITLMNNGRPVLVLNASHITAKTLNQEITKNIESFEIKAGVKIQTISELLTKFK